MIMPSARAVAGKARLSNTTSKRRILAFISISVEVRCKRLINNMPAAYWALDDEEMLKVPMV